MKPTRRTQPFKKGAATRTGAGLRAALRGATAGGQNPMDVQRTAAKNVTGGTSAPTSRSTAPAGPGFEGHLPGHDRRPDTGGTPAPTRRPKKGGLRGAMQKATAGIGPKITAAPGSRKAPAGGKGAGERVRAPKGAKRALRDGLTPRIYSTGTRENTSGNERAGQSFRTFTVGGKEFHEYVDPKTNKRVVVAGGKKSTKRSVNV